MINEQAYFAANALQFIQKARVAAQVRKTHLAKTGFGEKGNCFQCGKPKSEHKRSAKSPSRYIPCKGKKCPLTNEVLKRAEKFEEWLNEEVEAYVKLHPAYDWFSRVKGVGNLNIGKVVSLIDIEKATMISKVWRYTGFAPGDKGEAERQVRGQKLHYNKVLKAMCWRLAKSLIRAKGAYYEFYLEQKQRYTERFIREGYIIVPSLELPIEKDPKTGKKKHVEKDGFFALGHVDTMAMRKMIKLFLSHLWLTWREAEGLPITAPYVHAIKGHTDYRPPEDFMELEPEQKKQAKAQLKKTRNPRITSEPPEARSPRVQSEP